jgi:hypothetical protein
VVNPSRSTEHCAAASMRVLPLSNRRTCRYTPTNCRGGVTVGQIARLRFLVEFSFEAKTHDKLPRHRGSSLSLSKIGRLCEVWFVRASRRRDFQAFEGDQRRLVECGRRLVGSRVVHGATVVTAYRETCAKERRLPRGRAWLILSVPTSSRPAQGPPPPGRYDQPGSISRW